MKSIPKSHFKSPASAPARTIARPAAAAADMTIITDSAHRKLMA